MWFFFDSIFPVFFIVFFIIFVVMFVGAFVRGISTRRKNNNSPRLSVDAKCVSKRGDVTVHHNSSTHTAHRSTTYYATFEFESGDRLELAIPRNDYGYLVEGDFGKLIFQGTRFIEFRRNY